MPYDPRMLQMAQQGVRMMGPERGSQQPQQWWEQPQPAPPRSYGTPSDGANAPEQGGAKQPPSMFDMMMGLGRMTRPQYDKAIQSSPPGQQQGLAQVSPWAWLGNMGMPGGGWGGGRP